MDEFAIYYYKKMLERAKYKKDRMKANILADIFTFLILLFVGYVSYLRVIGG